MEVVEEKRVGYKKTKLGWIPDNWESLSVADVFKFLKTNSLSRSQLINESLNENFIYNIHYGDIHSSFKYELLDVSNESILPRIINNELIQSEPDYLKEGDVIMADVSEDYEGLCDCVELKNVKNIKLVSGLHTFALRDKSDNFCNGFKSYLFKSDVVVKSLNRIATGVSVLGVSKSNLSKVLIPIPTLPEQTKIASILSTWDAAIETTQTLINKLQTRKKGLIQQLLTGKIRLDGFNKEWKEHKFGDLISERKEFPLEPLPLYSLTIESGVVPKTKRYERSFLLKSTKDAYKIMYQNDFALNPMNLRFGAIAKYKDKHKVCVSKYYNIFYFNNSCNSSYMEYYLSSYNMVQYYNKMAMGTLEEKKRVHYSDFVNFKKTLPNLNEQNAIVEVLQTSDQEIEHYKKYLEQLKAQKKGLIQQLLTGKIRVKV